MMAMKRNWKRLGSRALALLMVLVMSLGLLPMGAFTPRCTRTRM